jgi:hypothetical protein
VRKLPSPPALSGRLSALLSWFRSFVVAWLLVALAAAALGAIGVEMRAAAGVAALVAVTVAVRALVWRARPSVAGSTWRGAARLAIPGLIDRRVVASSMQAGASALMGLRAVFLSFVIAMVAIAVVVLVLAAELDDYRPVSAAWTASVVVVLSAGAVGAERRIGGRLDCSSREALLAAYRQRFFLRIALSQSAALLGFVGFLVAQHPGIYFLGAAFTVVGFMHAAPTRTNLGKDDSVLAARGCQHRLAELQGPDHPEPNGAPMPH